MTHDVQTRGQKCISIGNGASAAMASHFAADACKNGRLRAQAFNDVALLTATANDLAFEEVFALPLDPLRPGRRHADRDQQLGQLAEHRAGAGTRAGAAAADRDPVGQDAGQSVAAHSATSTSTSRTQRYGWIESAHHVVLHYWLDQYLNVHGQGAM